MIPDPDWLVDKKTAQEWAMFLEVKFHEPTPTSEEPMSYFQFRDFIEHVFFVNAAGELERNP